jgi:hypothetical protein
MVGKLDRILFGDNQFFGVNHMSEEKARQQAMRFQKLDAVLEVLHAALEEGAPGFMCTTHDRVAEIAEVIRREPARWAGFQFYPCMPYAHKYANAVTEHGYFDAVRRFLPNDGFINTLMRGGMAVIGRDIEGVMKLLVDAEMKPFEDFKPPVIFLQNVVTDLLIGLGFVDAFRIFSDHVRERYNAEAGFITMNLPKLLPMLGQAGIENPIVCANVNKIAFRMSGGIDGYREATRATPARVIAMSVLASGAINPREAIEWVVDEPYVESILFGASSRANIASTVRLIREFDERRAVA